MHSLLQQPDAAQAARGMVLIPAGSFAMGATGFGSFEDPVHSVYLDAYWMDETPVTNAEFAHFAAATGYRTEAEERGAAWGWAAESYGEVPGLHWRTFMAADRLDHPVVLISWNDANAYCRWAGKRLPTEAEWEKAALGGRDGSLYPWGADVPDGSQSNFARDSGPVPATTHVRRFAPNAYGLYDMVGNVWQWCADGFSEYALHDPGAAAEASVRCRRGGAWNVIQPFRLRCANRGAAPPSSAAPNIGFRCVMTPTTGNF